MAIAQLFFKKGNYIGDIELDIIIKESATATARVTENPVEFGADVNDHIIIQPMTFSIQGVVSNSLSRLQDLNTFSGLQGKAKSESKWDDLLKLQADRTPFTLVQGLKTYENVVILSLIEDQDKDTSNGLFFTALLKEVIFVGSQIITKDQFNDIDISDKMVPTTTGGLKQQVGL